MGALNAIQGYNKGDPPLFLLLTFQTPHSPFENIVPDWPCPKVCEPKTDETCPEMLSCIYKAMIWRSDVYVGKIVHALRVEEMWDNSLVLLLSDNGGSFRSPGSNFPLRGGKGTNWNEGITSLAIVSGGLVPSELHNTVNP